MGIKICQKFIGKFELVLTTNFFLNVSKGKLKNSMDIQASTRFL